MLDLRTLKEKTWDLTMFDGEVLHIKRPSQRMVIDMMGYEETFSKKDKNTNKMIAAFVDMLTDILNNNTQGKVFTKEFVGDSFDFTLGMAVVQQYMQFVSEVNSDPN